MPTISYSLLLLCSVVGGADGNRLSYLDEYADPYHVGSATAKLTTPQWVGEEGVEAVVALTIDDLRDIATYEQFLRPILDRLKTIDGRAPVSIFTNQVDPQDEHIQVWLQEGVTLEAHTVDHPCPCLQSQKSFEWSRDTYHRCIDLLAQIPNQRTVAFRMPCCDSMPSVSPRFFTEIFNHTTPEGNFLALDSSVLNVFTTADPAVAEYASQDEEGKLRFDKYLPRERGLWNWVENYPYPFVIAKLCWEIPAAIPDDWQGFNLQGKGHPNTIRDMQRSLDATVTKQGVFTLLFHPHRWISNDQVNQLIDYSVDRYGSHVKVLSMREIHDRLTQNLLAGQPLRAADGGDNGVRLLDVNHDGFMDVVIGNSTMRQTRIWSPETGSWVTSDFPVQIVDVDEHGRRHDAGVRFGVLQPSGQASFLVRSQAAEGLWHFDGRQWVRQPHGLDGLTASEPIPTVVNGVDHGVRLRDLDQDGICEVVVGNPDCQAVFAWSASEHQFQPLSFSLPGKATIVDDQGRDAGLRFVDLDSDQRLDVVFSNARHWSVHRLVSIQQGWSQKMIAGRQGEPGSIPPIVRQDGSNNGVWFKSNHMWVQNEETGVRLPQHCERIPFAQLLGNTSDPVSVLHTNHPNSVP